MPVAQQNSDSLMNLQQYLASEIPPTLWHYTSLDVCKSIIENKEIWATHYRFLNDTAEVMHMWDRLEAYRDNLSESNEIRQAFDLALSMRPKHNHHETDDPIMVACFSAGKDQLTQWRGYAHGSSGASIGLKLDILRDHSWLGKTFAPCMYESSDKEKMLDSIVTGYQELLKRFTRTRSPAPEIGPFAIHHSQRVKQQRDTIGNLVQLLKQQLLAAGCFMKREEFAHEQEWRFVRWGSQSHDHKSLGTFHFRSTRDAIVPYIKVPLIAVDDDKTPSQMNESAPCNDLILGPGSHPFAEVGMNQLLKSQKLSFECRRSSSSYRPW